MRTIAQERAEFALKKVLTIDADKKEFKAFASGAPAMILQNGFGQSLAFWLAKGSDKELKAKRNDKHINLFDIVSAWLHQNDKKNFDNCKQRKDYIDRLIKINQRDYLAAQNETLALLEWIKRFAAADLS